MTAARSAHTAALVEIDRRREAGVIDAAQAFIERLELARRTYEAELAEEAGQ